ncbi:MAG TPA: nuclear transport factor 2 family protein [Polyangiaceae bacterium]|jgi:ketosteroid isomerase-like protein|nr:nuclear transport factor 2 family protein [Polyangiaceae bacterium]
MQGAVEKELLALEKRYWQAIKDKDVETAMRMTHDPCIVAGASGAASIGRDTFVKMMSGAKYTLNAFELGDAKVLSLSDDVAVLAYKVHEDLTVDGKNVSMDAADCSTWVKKSGRWLCAAHTESLLGDPYGRDRAQVAKR